METPRERISFVLPIKGYSTYLPPENQPQLTTPVMKNVRIPSSKDRKLRLGPRPGLRKLYTDRIGGNSLYPVVELISVSTVA